MQWNNLRIWLLAFLFAALLPALGVAQSYEASIGGTVTDPSGAVVPNAELTLQALATGLIVKNTTGSEGLYTFPHLLEGNYQLTVTAKGFRTYVQKGISIHLSDTLRNDVRLEIGATAQTVEVKANASPLNFENGAQVGELSPEKIQDLPLIVQGISRTAEMFVMIEPGITTGGMTMATPYAAIRFNGGMVEGDDTLLDGVTMMDGAGDQSGMAMAETADPLTPEAIDEAKLLSSNFQPQYGGTTSSVFIAVTKSGTNEFHGSVYDYARNAALNARQFGIATRPVDIENDGGAAIGGPVKLPFLWSGKRKTYFFMDFGIFRKEGGATAPVLSIPSMLERQGNFTDWKDTHGNLIPIFDPATTQVDPITGVVSRQQFMGCNGSTPNVICPSDPRMQNSLAPNWLKYLPNPTSAGPLNNYSPHVFPTGGYNSSSNYPIIRIDHYEGNNDRFSFTMYRFDNLPNQIGTLPAQLTTENPSTYAINLRDRGSWDHTFRPNLLNNLIVGYNDMPYVEQCLDTPFAGTLPQIAGVQTHSVPSVLTFSGFNQLGCNSNDRGSRPVRDVSDMATWVRGKHIFKFGGEFRWEQTNHVTHPNESGTFNFTSLNTGLLTDSSGNSINSGNSIASFLLGDVGNASAGFTTLDAQYARERYSALYAGDTWKVTPKLTLDLGLRWDVGMPATEKFNNASYFDPLGTNSGAGNLPGRLAFAGTKWGAASLGRSAPEYTWLGGIGPRVGLAYALSPKTVARLGYGIFYSQLYYPGWSGGVNGAEDGFNTTASFASSEGGLVPAFNLSQGFPQNFTHPPFINSTFDNGAYVSMYRPFDAGRLSNSQQWTVTIEHQFTNDTNISVAYVANKGTHLLASMDPANALNPSLLSMGSKLNAQFQPGQTTLDGVPIPYAGWVQQMTGCSPSVAQALLPFPQYCGSLTPENENDGNSSFNSLQVKLEKRYSRGLWVLASYTLEKWITDTEDIQTGATAWGSYGATISPYERQRNKSLASVDTPNTLAVTFIYDLPVGKGQHFLNKGGVADKVLGGWEISSLFRAQSGVPFYFLSGTCDVPGQFATGCIPGILPGANAFAQSKGNFDPTKPLLNVNAFEPASGFNFYTGQGSRISNVRGFPSWNQDIDVLKTIPISERVKLQFRAGFFNAWNTHFFLGQSSQATGEAFDTNLSDPNFGMWTGSVSAPRSIQVGAKLIF